MGSGAHVGAVVVGLSPTSRTSQRGGCHVASVCLAIRLWNAERAETQACRKWLKQTTTSIGEMAARKHKVIMHLGVPLLRQHDQGDQEHPGTWDMKSMQKWKDQVRRFVRTYTKEDDCSAFQERTGAVPNELARVSAPTQRSEQFLGWCAAFYADDKRGRWQKWTLEQRDHGLQHARELFITGQMMCKDGRPANTQIMNSIESRFPGGFP